MKLKLDENLPSRAINVLKALGHDVETAVEEGLAGKDDPVLLGAATSEGRLLVTLDRGLGDIRSYPPGTHAGILVIRLSDQSPRAVAVAMDLMGATVEFETLAGCIGVFRDGELRVRRPPRGPDEGPGETGSRRH